MVRRLIRVFAGASALAVAFGLLSLSAVGSAQDTVQGQSDIFFSAPHLRFGVGGRGEEVSKTFVYENRGTADLVIDAVKAGCGQQVADVGARILPPGQTSTMTVSVRLGNHVGPQRFPFVVQSNDPDSPEVTVVLSGTVATGIMGSPDNLAFGKVNKGSRALQTIAMRDLDRSALSPRRTVTEAGFLTAEIQPDEAADGHGWGLSVALDGEKAPLGPFAEVVTVELSQPGQAPRRVDFPVTGVVVSAAAPADSQPPAFAGTLAFVANAGGNWDVFRWSGGVAAPRQVTDTAYDEKWPSLVGAEGAVAFTTTEGVPGLADPAGGAPRTLAVAERPGKWDNCGLSPDGRSLACAYFAPTAADRAELAVVDLETLQARPLVEQFGPQFFPAWSPDARRIVYAYAHCSTACGRIIQEIWVADVLGGNARQLLMTNAHCERPSWSPDGQRLAFAADIEGNYDLWLYDLASEKLIRLTDYPGLDESPAFGPDGKQVAFISNRGGRKGLWIKDLGSGEERELKPFGYALVEIKDVAWGWPEPGSGPGQLR